MGIIVYNYILNNNDKKIEGGNFKSIFRKLPNEQPNIEKFSISQQFIGDIITNELPRIPLKLPRINH